MSAGKPPVGAIVWTDLTVADAPRLREFYAAVAGWRPQPVGMGDYDDWSMQTPAGGQDVAGICHARGSNAGLPPQWLVYVTVADLAQSIRRCRELGGEVLVGPRPLGGQQFAVIRDPAGAVCALVQ